MRIASVIFAGSVAALLAIAPASARNTTPQKTDDKSTSSTRHAYRQAADGSWTELPCQEFGNGQVQPRPGAKGSEEEPR